MQLADGRFLRAQLVVWAAGVKAAPWLKDLAGLETRDGALWLHPALPPEIAKVRFEMTYRSHGITLDLTPTTLILQLQPRPAASIRVHVDGETATLHPGHSYRFDLRGRAAALTG